MKSCSSLESIANKWPWNLVLQYASASQNLHSDFTQLQHEPSKDQVHERPGRPGWTGRPGRNLISTVLSEVTQLIKTRAKNVSLVKQFIFCQLKGSSNQYKSLITNCLKSTLRIHPLQQGQGGTTFKICNLQDDLVLVKTADIKMI